MTTFDTTGAPCEADPDLFFADTFDRASTVAAKQVCARCPVRVDCLAKALETREPFGIWGGLTPQERRSIRRPDCIVCNQPLTRQQVKGRRVTCSQTCTAARRRTTIGHRTMPGAA